MLGIAGYELIVGRIRTGRTARSVARYPLPRISHRSLGLVLTLLVVATAGCSGEPAFVYVLEKEQTVELTASASSAKLRVGDSLVLHAVRRTKGNWKRIPSSERAPDQCWMAQPPPEFEEEVADNVRWDVTPTGSARFNTDHRPDRTRLVTVEAAGQFTLTPVTTVWCEAGRAVSAPSIQIEVSPR